MYKVYAESCSFNKICTRKKRVFWGCFVYAVFVVNAYVSIKTRWKL